MGVRFVKRVAGEMLGRGMNSIRIKPTAMENVKKAITREDVKKYIADGSVYAIKQKHNLSLNSKELKIKRSKGRRRGIGKRKGTRHARSGREWEKKVRAQRSLLKELKKEKNLDGKTFGRFYKLIKGNAFADKASLLLHLRENNIIVSDEELKRINERIRKRYVIK